MKIFNEMHFPFEYAASESAPIVAHPAVSAPTMTLTVTPTPLAAAITPA